MKTSRLLRTAIVAALLFSTLGLTALDTVATAAGSGSSSISDVGTSANGKGVNSTTTKGGTQPICNKRTGAADWNGIAGYVAAPAPQCEGGTWTKEILRCIIGYDEIRIYGTQSNPAQAGTLSHIYNLDWCLPNDQTLARLYWPNPKDAASIPLQTIWNVGNPSSNKEAGNARGENVAISDYCATTNDQARCATTSMQPRLRTGKVCSDLQVKGDASLSAAMSSTIPGVKQSVQEYVYGMYKSTLAGIVSTPSHKNAVAAALAGLPVSGLTAKSYKSPADVTSVGSGPDCSSMFDFIPAFKPATVDPVQIGTCVMPIYVPARKYIIKGEAVLAPWGAFANSVNVPRYLDTPVAIRNPNIGLGDLAAPVNGATAKSQYASMITRLITNDPGTFIGGDYDETMKISGYFFPEDLIKNYGIEALLYPAGQAQAKATMTRSAAAASALNAAQCFAARLAPWMSEKPKDDPKTDPTPRPTTTSTTTTTTTDTPTSAPAGPVKVVVTVKAPKVFTVGGTSRVQDVKVTDVSVYSNGHICDGRDSDARVSTPQGSLDLAGVNGYTTCSDSKQRSCGLLVTKPSGTGSMISRSLSSVFYSPTRSSEKARILLGDMSARVVPRKLITPAKPPKECTTTTVTDVKTKVSTQKTTCVQPPTPPPYWIDDTAAAYTITQFEIRFDDGGTRDRAVTGTIGK